MSAWIPLDGLTPAAASSPRMQHDLHPVATIAVDGDWRIVMADAAAQQLFGCTAQQCLGADVFRFVPGIAALLDEGERPDFDQDDADEETADDGDRARHPDLPSTLAPAPAPGRDDRVRVAGLRLDGQPFRARLSSIPFDSLDALGLGDCRLVRLSPDRQPANGQAPSADAGNESSADIERSRLELQRLSASLVEAREVERRRIARELHDELGQQLLSLKMELSTLKSSARSPAQSSQIDGMRTMVDETVASVRRIAADLRPLMLDDLGLNAAVEWLARESSRRAGLEITLHLGDYAEPINERASIALYRMVQEALTNIARHAKARRVMIGIEQAASELRLTVQDDGVGFAPNAMHRDGSHGLMGMRERAHMLGGHLEIGASAGGGGRVAVTLPLESTRDATSEPPSPPAGRVSPLLPGEV